MQKANFFQVTAVLFMVCLQAKELDETVKHCGKFADRSLKKGSGFYEGFETAFENSGQDVNNIVSNFKKVFNNFYSNGSGVEDSAIRAFQISTNFQFILEIEKVLFNITLKAPQGEMTFPAFTEKCGRLYKKYRKRTDYIGYNTILESAIHDLLNSEFSDLSQDRKKYVKEWCRLKFRSPLHLFPEAYNLYHHHNPDYVKDLFKETFKNKTDALLCSIAVAYDALRACAITPVWKTLKGQCLEIFHELREESQLNHRSLITQKHDGHSIAMSERSHEAVCYNVSKLYLRTLFFFNTLLLLTDFGLIISFFLLTCCVGSNNAEA